MKTAVLAAKVSGVAASAACVFACTASPGSVVIDAYVAAAFAAGAADS